MEETKTDAEVVQDGDQVRKAFVKICFAGKF
jgi:hypothetical protein